MRKVNLDRSVIVNPFDILNEQKQYDNSMRDLRVDVRKNQTKVKISGKP